jgi:hypothetical protein
MLSILPFPRRLHCGLLRGFRFRICQMRVRVSTNRPGWQIRGESNPNAADLSEWA